MMTTLVAQKKVRPNWKNNGEDFNSITCASGNQDNHSRICDHAVDGNGAKYGHGQCRPERMNLNAT